MRRGLEAMTSGSSTEHDTRLSAPNPSVFESSSPSRDCSTSPIDSQLAAVHSATYRQARRHTRPACSRWARVQPPYTPVAMDEYLRANRRLWDAWTDIHVRSAFYDVESFRAGGDREVRIKDYEREEVGDVRGKRLLHLQCHFGLETLSWARLGATVTGVGIIHLTQGRPSTRLLLDGAFWASDLRFRL